MPQVTGDKAQKLIKILYVVTKSNWGGAQRYVYDLATNLPEDQYEVAVAFGGTGMPGSPPGQLAVKLRGARIRTIMIPELGRDVSPLADFASLFALVQLFRKERPDVIHLNSSKAGGLGAVAGWLAQVPRIIFTVHGWPFWEERSALILTFIRFFSWMTLLFAHRVICISNYDLVVAQHMPFGKRRAMLIHNAIGSIDFLPRTTAPQPLQILTNAELAPNKNLFTAIDTVIEMRRRNADIHYSIMSNGELREALETYVRKNNAETFIELLGFIPDGRRHYHNYDIFFLPSRKEGVPYVLLEAGIARLPVVASNVGGIPEIIEHEQTGLLASPENIQQLANALERLVKDKTLREQYGTALKQKVEREFSVEQMLQKTYALYQRKG